jgi:hypothetical protein
MTSRLHRSKQKAARFDETARLVFLKLLAKLKVLSIALKTSARDQPCLR